MERTPINLKFRRGSLSVNVDFTHRISKLPLHKVTGSSDTLFSLDYLEVALNVNVTPNS